MNKILDNYQRAFSNYLYSEKCGDDLEAVVEKIKQYKRILLIANGGSHVGVAMHFEEDCSKLVGIPCLTLSNPGYITCLGNDCGFENIYVEWLKPHYQEGDLLIAISSSGESPDIVNAAHYGTPDLITLTGFKKNNRLSQLGQINVQIPIENYGIVESLHGVFLHMVLDILVEEKNKCKK